jgi:GT2 family glycosyltransferase
MAWLEAIADDVRLGILRHLSQRDDATVADLARAAGAHPNTVRSRLSALEDAEVVAGLVRFIAPARRTVWALIDMETFLDQELAVSAGTAVAANLFVRRDLFERLGGFDESLSRGSDRIFVARCVAADARLMFEPRAVVWHPARARGREFLGKLWAVNRRHGERESREGRRPAGLAFRTWVPLVGTVRSRRRHGRSLVLDRRRLSDSGIKPRHWDDVRALPVIYLLVPYLSACAQAFGWWHGRRRRASQTTAVG